MLWESKVSFKHSEVLSYQSANGNIGVISAAVRIRPLDTRFSRGWR